MTMTTLSTDAVAGCRRRISMSRTGRWLLVAQEPQVELVDLFGTMPTRTVPAIAGPVEIVGRELWGLDGGALTRIAPADLRVLPGPPSLPVRPMAIVPGVGSACTEALLTGAPPCRISCRDQAVVIEPIEGLLDGEAPIAIHGARLFVTSPGMIRAVDRTRGEAWRAARLGGDVVAMSVLFGGRALALLVRRASDDAILVLHGNGARIHQVSVARVQRWAVAEELGHAFLLGGDQALTRVDLRYGRAIAEGRPPFAIGELAVDQDGRHAVLASADGGEVLQVLTSELVVPLPAPVAVDADLASSEPAAPATLAEGSSVGVPIDIAAPPPVPVDARAGEPPAVEPRARPRTVVVPDDLPLALGPPPPLVPPQAAGVSPYPSGRAHLDALLDIVAARTAVAIADAWNSGRLSPTHATRRPHELEVEALLGGSGSFAAEKLAETKARLVQRQEEASSRAHASAAQGIRLPFPSLVRELGLSGVAAQILLVVAAPALRGEIARLYGVLSNDPARPMVDRFLVEQIVAGERSTLRDQIARELAADAALVRHGVVQVETSPVSLFARLSVSDALLDRLRGLAPVRVDDAAVVRGADVTLDALFISPAIKRDLVLALSAAPPPHAPWGWARRPAPRPRATQGESARPTARTRATRRKRNTRRRRSQRRRVTVHPRVAALAVVAAEVAVAAPSLRMPVASPADPSSASAAPATRLASASTRPRPPGSPAPAASCRTSTRSSTRSAGTTSRASRPTPMVQRPAPTRPWARRPTRPATPSRSPRPARRSTPRRTRPRTSCSSAEACSSRAASARSATPTSNTPTRSPIRWSRASAPRICSTRWRAARRAAAAAARCRPRSCSSTSSPTCARRWAAGAPTRAPSSGAASAPPPPRRRPSSPTRRSWASSAASSIAAT
jgi:hypothetical protein